jgi:hypothetical protein
MFDGRSFDFNFFSGALLRQDGSAIVQVHELKNACYLNYSNDILLENITYLKAATEQEQSCKPARASIIFADFAYLRYAKMQNREDSSESCKLNQS